MRRAAAVCAALLMIMMLSCAPAAAGNGRLSAVYVPRSERGTLFFVDISYDSSLSAGMLELDYDSALAEYRSVSAAADSTTVKARAEGGTVRIVIGDSDRISGRLCRVSFKAIGSGSAAFTLRMMEGVDGDLNRIDPPASCELSVSLNGSGSSGASSVRSGRVYEGSSSSKSTVASSSGATADEPPVRKLRDISRDPAPTVILMGVGAGVLAALLVIGGFLLGRRSRGKKKKPAETNGGEEDNSDEE